MSSNRSSEESKEGLVSSPLPPSEELVSSPLPPSKSRERNKRKKLRKAAKRGGGGGGEGDQQKSIKEVGSGGKLYMFVCMHDGGYLLYRIEALKHASESYENSELLPLLVFAPHHLPAHFCTLVHMGHFLYFVGEESHHVYKLPKKILNKLIPDQTNLGFPYLTKTEPMKGPKQKPLVFVANDNLCVISPADADADDAYCEESSGFEIDSPPPPPRDYSHDFEMYSPTRNSWKLLIPKPNGHGSLKSHLVVDNTVYFATTHETVLSFDLTNNRWGVVSTAPKNPRAFCDIRPAFGPPVFFLGDKLFGGFYLETDFKLVAAASPHTCCVRSTKDYFMRPTLAPSYDFWEKLHPRVHHICNDKMYRSHYMAPLHSFDGETETNILCLLSYGWHPLRYEPHRSYLYLTFYRVLPGYDTTRVRSVSEVFGPGDWFCYFSRQMEEEGKIAVKSYFKSEFIRSKLLTIKTTRLRTIGKVVTAFSC